MVDSENPHCPECGEPIGQTATYCMHCSADLTDEQAAADTNDDGAWDAAGSSDGSADSGNSAPTYGPLEDEGGDATVSTDAGGQLLDPDGIVDNTLTVVVGIAGGVVVGIVGTIALLVIPEAGGERCSASSPGWARPRSSSGSARSREPSRRAATPSPSSCF